MEKTYILYIFNSLAEIYALMSFGCKVYLGENYTKNLSNFQLLKKLWFTWNCVVLEIVGLAKGIIDDNCVVVHKFIH